MRAARQRPATRRHERRQRRLWPRAGGGCDLSARYLNLALTARAAPCPLGRRRKSGVGTADAAKAEWSKYDSFRTGRLLGSKVTYNWTGALPRIVCGDWPPSAPKLLSLRKLRNHFQFGGSPYCPASQRTKAVKPTMKNCPKVRSRRTISLVLCTNRPLFLRGRHRNRKLVLKCDPDSNKIDRCKNLTV